MLETKTILIGTLKELNDYFYNELCIKNDDVLLKNDTSKNDDDIHYIECDKVMTIRKQLDLIVSGNQLGKVMFIQYHSTPDSKRTFTLMSVYVNVLEYDDKNINDMLDRIHCTIPTSSGTMDEY